MKKISLTILLVMVLSLLWISLAAAEAGDADIEGQVTAVDEVGLTITVVTLDGEEFLVSFPPDYEFGFTAADVGSYVHVLGEFLSETTILAESVEGLPDADVEGEIVAVDEEGETITLKTAEGEEILIRFLDGFGFTAGDIGSFVHVQGVFLKDGSILALSVETVEPPEDEDDEGKSESAYCSDKKDHPHPVALTLANVYDVPVEEIMGYFCDGFGFGQIALALHTSKVSGVDVPTLLASRTEGMGWGEIWKDLGYHGKPKEDKENKEDKADKEDKVPPGQQKKTDDPQKDKEHPSNSNKDKDKVKENNKDKNKEKDKDKDK